MQRTLFNFLLAIEGVFANQLRAFLTALGIVFGVGAVIAMLAIGTGAKQSILEQMKLIGTNNIVVNAILPENDDNAVQSDDSNGKESTPWSPGLTIEDVRAIEDIIPTIDRVSPEVLYRLNLISDGKLQKVNCIGISNDFFELNNLQLDDGSLFHFRHMEKGLPVCIIGKGIEAKFFSEVNPIGQKLKCGNVWLTVIGVLERRIASEESLEKLGIRDYNMDVYIPLNTALIRFQNRSMVDKGDIQRQGRGNQDESSGPENYHQLDKVVFRVAKSNQLQASADVMARILKRKHHEVLDYEITIPELLLQQQQKTQETFNLVLAVIAGISLLVGGIGIMNIMLASVLERIKEIGVRRSMGATRSDIVLQFLFESIFISLIGGLIGVFLGITAANTIASYADIPTVISTWSIVLAFGVAASIGLIFGIFPAQKAAMQDPIKALRSD